MLEPLGEGGFGVAYRAELEAGAAVVKLMRRSGLLARTRARLEREFGALLVFSHHPGVVTVRAGGRTAADRWFVVRDYVAGQSVEAALARGARFPWPAAARIGVRLAEAVCAAHEAGLLHRDIKPANVFLRPDGAPLLADCGLGAIACSDTFAAPAALSSLAYAAPEAARTARLEPSADVYALAATVRAMLAGRPAGPGFAAAHASQLPFPTRRAPAALAEVLMQAMAPAPEDRPRSAGAFRAQLELAARRRTKVGAGRGLPPDAA